MKILHTSDWHLGRSLYGRKRYEEFTQFLDWLLSIIKKEHIDVVLVAGDIFDTTTPSNRAQELYYAFLNNVAQSCCQHIVIIAGNHDSPTFLDAPKELLRALHVHVVGTISDAVEDEVLVLRNKKKVPQAIICSVPYLRDKDIRTVTAGETMEDKNRKLVEGLKKHYADVCACAEEKLESFKKEGYTNIPLIGMGHLFTFGGEVADEDGVRELYVGSLAYVDKSAFPPALNYLALGHLHVPQRVAGTDIMRYSGSPLPMGFGEAHQTKKVIIISCTGTALDMSERAIPCFQRLEKVQGTLDAILSKIALLKKEHISVWIEVEYTGHESVGNVRQKIEKSVTDSLIDIIRIKNRSIIERVMRDIGSHETLDDIDEKEVFKRCLDTHHIDLDEREELTDLYNRILISLEEDDNNAQ